MDAQCLTLACQRPLALMEQQFVQHHALFPVLKTICIVMVDLISMDAKGQTPVFQKMVYNTYISIRLVIYHLIMYSFEGMCTAVCPIICPPDQETCPGGTNNDGCPMPNTCITKTFGTNGSTVCPEACPVPCPADHLYCDGGFDVNGCKKPNTCVPKEGIQFLYQCNICDLLIDYVFL